MKRFARWIGLGVVLAALAVPATAGSQRYEKLTAWAAGGKKAQVATATFFGGEGIEGFVDVAELPDGRIVAFGNAYTPPFPAEPAPTVLGSGTYSGSKPTYEKKKRGKVKIEIRDDTPDESGFMVFYSPGLRKIDSVVRFDWGVASIETASLAGDKKGLILIGRATPTLVKLATSQGAMVKRGDGQSGKVTFYVMRTSLDGKKIQWFWGIENARSVPERMWEDDDGNVYFTMLHLHKITADGKSMSQVGSTKEGGPRGVRYVDGEGNFYYGGDRNTNTGKEPWRQPFLYKYSPAGEKLWTMWEYPSRNLRDGKGNEEGMVSDSSIKGMTQFPNGDFLFIGWSDGGNSLFTRQPTAVPEPAPKPLSPFTTWGMKNANSLSYIMRVDPQTKEQLAWSYWMAYVPESFGSPKYRGAPNGTSIKDITFLPKDHIGFTGGSATGLISTPNAFYKHSGPDKYGGPYAAIWNANFSNLVFSSYLPGYKSARKQPAAHIAPTRYGMVVCGMTARDDGKDKPTPPPSTGNAPQKEFGGNLDGHIFLLKVPGTPAIKAAAAAPAPKPAPTATDARPAGRAGLIADKDPQPEPKPVPKPKETPEQQADAKLGLARSYMASGLQKKARGILEKVVADFPGTDAAKKARKLLRKLK